MTTIPEALALAVAHHQAGRLEAAEEIYRQILQVEPRHSEVLHLRGLLASQSGQHQFAVACIRQAVLLDPNQAAFHCDLGLAYLGLGHWGEAEACCRHALHLQPVFPEAHNNLGIAHAQQGRLDEAIASYRKALDLRPDYPEACNNLGAALRDQGRRDEAVASYRQALRLRPDDPEALVALGAVLAQQGQRDEAIACWRQALVVRPECAEAHYNLGTVFQAQRQPAEACACYRQALRLRPSYVEAHYNLGIVLQGQGQLADAIVSYQRAIEGKPGYAEAHNNLGNALRDQGRLAEAIACYERALDLRPDFAEAHNNRGNALKAVGLLDEALAAYRRALVLNPDSAACHSNLVYALHYHPATNPRTLGEELARWQERHASPLARLIRPHANDPDPKRRLRVGYVSADLRRHPVGIFLLPLLEAHDHANFEICCYASAAVPDDLTERLRGYADTWRDVAGLTDEQLADQVREDRIDVLVDLGAHTAQNRLMVFARKPAPVQVSYLAYCSSTGLSAMDYRLTDPYLDPSPGSLRCSARHLPLTTHHSPLTTHHSPLTYTEESVWLPETYWCYRPLIEVAPAGPLPALAAGYVTFGCLNNFCKAAPPALAAWRDLLRAVPGSRLLVHAHPGPHRDRVVAFFTEGKVNPGRVEFVGFTSLADYFRLYDRIDIGLDPFPFAGGTTTCDALWMGVPVVSLAGETAVGRAGLSILSNVGLPELAARTPEQYVDSAVGLAGNLPRLASLRAGLRQRVRESPLMNVPRFARNVEAAYRAMWRRWCLRVTR